MQEANVGIMRAVSAYMYNHTPTSILHLRPLVKALKTAKCKTRQMGQKILAVFNFIKMKGIKSKYDNNANYQCCL